MTVMKLLIGLICFCGSSPAIAFPQPTFGSTRARRRIYNKQQQQSNSLFANHHYTLQHGTNCAVAKSDNDNNISNTHTNDSDNENSFAKYQNPNNLNDQVFSALSGEGGIKVTAVTARNLLNELMLQHTLSAVSTEALGRTTLCGLLMANGIQDDQIVQISIRSEDGLIRGIVVIVNGQAQVRGYVGCPMLGPDVQLEEAVGVLGSVQIVKNHPSWPRPYNGITAIRHGDIDRDIGIYLAESEQRTCALAAATSVNGLLCTAAGGYLVELLPDATDEEKQKVEANLAKLVTIDGGDKLPINLLLKGHSPFDIANIIMDGLNMQPLQQMTPTQKCECTLERLVRSLRLLPVTEVEDILEKEERVEARCHFCGKVYRLEADEVRDRLQKATDDPSIDPQ